MRGTEPEKEKEKKRKQERKKRLFSPRVKATKVTA